MKCLLWKCWILTVALALVLVLGAFAEGSMSLPLAAALCLAGYRILRAAWAAEQRAERQAARRATRRRAPAAAGHSRPASGEAARPDSLPALRLAGRALPGGGCPNSEPAAPCPGPGRAPFPPSFPRRAVK